ncbi:MAG: restriction endonuclease subunit S [Synergistaceae bacterium]|nr:restriction endonuclease subunit S [Synergistaceae bacterium]
MSLSEYRLVELIELTTETNSQNIYSSEDVRGMTITKEIIPTKADVSAMNLKKFLVIRPGDLVFNPRTHGKHIGFGYNDTENNFLISWNNIGFRVKEVMKTVVLSEYLFMHFNRDEWDREACFRSWGSSTEVFSWEALCDMKITLPPLHIQRKYVDIYKAMLANQRAYERGLEDLKLVCDGYIEDLRRNMPCERIGRYIRECNERNDALKVERVQGVNSDSSFDETKANMSGIDIGKYKIVRKNQFAYNPSRINIGSIALLSEDVDVNSAIVSPMYIVFAINDQDKLLPEYLMLWFNRKEFHRSTLFYASGSVRDTFGFDDMCNVSIPIPDISIQRSIANIYNVYTTRKRINEKLKAQIKSICPILIKGAIEEAQSEAN